MIYNSIGNNETNNNKHKFHITRNNLIKNQLNQINNIINNEPAKKKIKKQNMKNTSNEVDKSTYFLKLINKQNQCYSNSTIQLLLNLKNEFYQLVII